MRNGLLKTAIAKAFRSRISIVGIAIVGVLLPILMLFLLLDLQGLISAPYFFFMINLIIGPLCGLGFLLIFVGLFFSRDKEDIGVYALEYIQEQLSRPGRYVRVRKLIYLAIMSTLLTVFILALASYKGYQYTESVAFCGQFCHKIMEPEYVTYKNSPHSSVRCVECHLDGKGKGLLTRSKISGIKQFWATATNSYERPIPTPIESLRPERENCDSCHRPEKFHGDRLYVKERFLPDRDNTPVRTVMIMRVGSAGYEGHKARGIHWHVSEDFKLRYRYTDKKRTKIVEVVLTQPDGKRKIFTQKAAAEKKAQSTPPAAKGTKPGKVRTMDCIDCHNRPAHIFLSPDEALDKKLLTGAIPRSVPFIKRQALAAITQKYGTAEAAMRGISQSIKSWYEKNEPEFAASHGDLLDQAVRGAQQAYRENVFPRMRIGWETYQNFLGHADGSGCFRCHGRLYEQASGKRLFANCDICHLIVAENKPGLDTTTAAREGAKHLLEE
jgi:nitrate/TMAO reductase-like tetraheme cytochrome c subunit